MRFDLKVKGLDRYREGSCLSVVKTEYYNIIIPSK